MKGNYLLACFLLLVFTFVACEKDDHQVFNKGNNKQSDTLTQVSPQQSDSLSEQVGQLDGKVAVLTDNLEENKNEVDSLKRVTEEQKNQLSSLKKNVETQKSELAQKLSLKNIIVLLLVIIVLFAAIFIVLFRKIQSMTKKKIAKVESKMNQPNSTISRVSNNSNTNSTDFKRINEKIADLGNKYEELRKAVASLSPQAVIKEVVAVNKTVTPRVDPAKEQGNVFYMGQPVGDSLFDNSLKSMVKNEDSFYTFINDNNRGDTATFKFDPYDEGRLKYAISYRQEIIGAVCDIEGNCDSGSGQYECKEGNAVLRDGKWNVTIKAIVKFK